MKRRFLLVLVVALLASVVVVGTPVVSDARAGEACRDLPGVGQTGRDPAGTTPVVLVHGFTGSDASWFSPITHTIDDDVAPIDRSMVEQLLRIDDVSVFTFDYHDVSTRWVTNDRIGGGLADLLTCLSESGASPAVVVAHSMGGLAVRQAVSLLDDPSIVSGVVTFGTPNLGSDTAAYFAAALDSEVSAASARAADPYGIGSVMWMWFRSELEACWNLRTENPDAVCEHFGGLPPLGSEAGKALQTGSSELGELPLLPESIDTLSIAGDIDIAVQAASGGPVPLIGWWYQDVTHSSVGDSLVSIPSATHYADETEVRTCQANFKAGYALSDDFRRIAQINYDDGKERPITKIVDLACMHTNLTTTVEFTNQALGFINDIVEKQKPIRYAWSDESDWFARGPSSQPHYSGCSPGVPDGLPDGVWFGFVDAWDASGLDFDLACFYGWVYHDDCICDLPEITNNSPRVRRLSWSAGAIGYPLEQGSGSLDRPIPVSDLIHRHSGMGIPGEVDWGVPAIIFVNDGQVTEIQMVFWS